MPWGISESAYNVRDRHDTYQYRAFGVPDLALKRGLASDLVVAPYATALALAVDAHEALANFEELERRGALGAYGFYDALDYTRVNPDERVAIVRTFMAHHIGMSLVALDNALSIGEAEAEGIWQRRFMTDPRCRATALLLGERILAARAAPATVGRPREMIEVAPPPASRCTKWTPHTPEPHVALLGGNGYSVLLTNTGSGHSRAGIDVLRGADATADDTGQWIYIKDLTAGALWSAAYQPVRATRHSIARRSPPTVIFARRDGAVDAHRDRRRRQRAGGDPARDAGQSIARRARAGADELRRSRALSGRGRPRASGISETVRGNGMGAGDRTARQPSPALRRGRVAVVRARRGVGRRARGRRDVRNRSRALSRPRTDRARAARAGRGRDLVRHGGRGA